MKITGIKNNSQETIENFYEEVWPLLENPYGKNDKILMELFNEEKYPTKNGNNIEVRIFVLNSMYQTNIHSLDIHEIISFIKKEHETLITNQFTNDNIINLINKCEEVNTPVSFFTKYCHWYNEVNCHKENKIPIFDTNVHIMIYKSGLACRYKKSDTNPRLATTNKKKQEKFSNYYDMFNEIYKKFENNNSPTHSTAHLLDKYLWLSYKIINAFELKDTGNKESLCELCCENLVILKKYFDIQQT